MNYNSCQSIHVTNDEQLAGWCTIHRINWISWTEMEIGNDALTSNSMWGKREKEKKKTQFHELVIEKWIKSKEDRRMPICQCNMFVLPIQFNAITFNSIDCAHCIHIHVHVHARVILNILFDAVHTFYIQLLPLRSGKDSVFLFDSGSTHSSTVSHRQLLGQFY